LQEVTEEVQALKKQLSLSESLWTEVTELAETCKCSVSIADKLMEAKWNMLGEFVKPSHEKWTKTVSMEGVSKLSCYLPDLSKTSKIISKRK
jgi:hypothetical protein